MMNVKDYEMFADYCEKVLQIDPARKDPNDHFYKSLPLCVMDAVFSIGVRYSTVEKTTSAYIEHFGLSIPRDVTPSKEHTTSDFLDNIKKSPSIEHFAEGVLHNKQRTSSRNGILKAEACRQIAEILRKHAVETLSDFIHYSDRDSLDKEILAVKGQSSGIMLRYLYMLAGEKNLIKPDRHVERFIRSQFPKATTQQDLQDMISNAATILKKTYPEMTPRFLDCLIWEYQRK